MTDEKQPERADVADGPVAKGASSAEHDGDVVKPGLPVSRRTFVIGGCALAAVLVAGVGVASCASCNARATGQLTGAANKAAGGFMDAVSQTGRDVQARAVAGEGLVRGTVCIDAGHAYDVSGRLYSRTTGTCLRFASMAELLLKQI